MTRPATTRRAVLTVLAGAVVWCALLLPDQLQWLTPAAVLVVPVEVLAVIVPALLLARRGRLALAVSIGLLIAVLTVVGLLDLGFEAVLDRSMNPISDVPLIGAGEDYLSATGGPLLAVGGTALAVVAILGMVAVITASVVRLANAVSRHRRGGLAMAVAVAVVWVTFLALGVQSAPGVPVAARNDALRLDGLVTRTAAGARLQREYAAQLAADPYAGAAPASLLSGLRGKDVILVFVESYGRSALEDPRLDTGVLPVLHTATGQLQADGFGARSGWLTSPTFGGSSWLAHSTLLSGTWVTNQNSYATLLHSSRLTLTRAFRDGGWRTVAVMPANRGPWPQGAVYDYATVDPLESLDYHGPSFGWAPMPDQFALSALQRKELAAPHQPLMSVVVLVSSHAPWSRIPEQAPWESLGDGSEFSTLPAITTGASFTDLSGLRAAYAESVQYSLTSLLDFVRRAATPNTVLVFLGDHQPAVAVTGPGASHDVPISVVTKDRAVLDTVAGWGWTPGLVPASTLAPWRMDAFRDRFLAAFSPGVG
jgi:Sulfatase